MFKRYLPFIILLIVASCGNRKEIVVKGHILNAANQMLVLKEMTNTDFKIIDSVKLNQEGEFKFKGKAERIAFYMLTIDNESKNYITLIVKPGETLKIEANALDFNKYKVKGSKESELVKELNSNINQSIDKIGLLRKTYDDSLSSINIMQIRAQLDSTYKQILKDQKEYTKSYIRNNLQNLTSLLALYQQLTPRTMVINPREDFEYFAMVDSSLMMIYPEAESVQSLHSMMDDLRKQNEQRLSLEKRIGIGATAPDIALPSPSGDTIKLSSLRGKYVLLDFWAGWCTPCRQENPNLVQNFWRYSSKGFTIYQVSIDQKKDSWTAAIQQDKIRFWSQVSDLKYWNSPVVKLYGIESIPNNFLLNPEGKIIAKNLRGDDLRAKLKEIYKY